MAEVPLRKVEPNQTDFIESRVAVAKPCISIVRVEMALAIGPTFATRPQNLHFLRVLDLLGPLLSGLLACPGPERVGDGIKLE